MDYVSAKMFLKLSDSKQQSILEWWYPKLGDFAFIYNADLNEFESEFYIVQSKSFDHGDFDTDKGKLRVLPLLRQKQLFDYIESKVGKFDINYDSSCGYVFVIYLGNFSAGNFIEVTHKHDMTEALLALTNKLEV